jgi:hypothetical protein
MKKINMSILGVYDMMLAFGAIFIGVTMLNTSNGLFSVYPKEWLYRVPFKSFVVPGFIAILLFGIGNILAAILSIKKENTKSWLASAIMGGLLFVSLITQVIVLGEWYMATVEFLLLSIGQLYLCKSVFVSCKKN